MLKQRHFLQVQIENLKNKLANYPKEHLILKHHGPYVKCYKSNGKISTYIPKKEKNLAIELARKKYNSQLYEDYLLELTLLNSFITKYQKLSNKSALLLNDEAFLKLFSDFSSIPANFNSHSLLSPNTYQNWIFEKYEKNPTYPEQLQHKCLSGEYVRSKSEVIIANTLFTHHLPYRYECAMTLGGITYYPDFTILNPSTLQILYWEHFGMMDIPNYCDKAFHKLKQFSHYGIIPDINLITTYETLQHPLDSKRIQCMVEELFEC